VLGGIINLDLSASLLSVIIIKPAGFLGSQHRFSTGDSRARLEVVYGLVWQTELFSIVVSEKYIDEGLPKGSNLG
jgi:hypothetical protein